jgi:hypothetical protein
MPGYADMENSTFPRPYIKAHGLLLIPSRVAYCPAESESPMNSIVRV